MIPSGTYYRSRTEYLHQTNTITRKEDERKCFSHLKAFQGLGYHGLLGTVREYVWTSTYSGIYLLLKELVKMYHMILSPFGYQATCFQTSKTVCEFCHLTKKFFLLLLCTCINQTCQLLRTKEKRYCFLVQLMLQFRARIKGHSGKRMKIKVRVGHGGTCL